MGAGNELVRAWLRRLSERGYEAKFSDAEQLASLLPELADGVTPPQYSLVEVDGFVSGDESDTENPYLEAELLARLTPPGPPNDPHASDALGLIDLSLDTESSELRLDTLDIPADMQQAGLGRRQMLQLVLLADDLGLDTIRLEAGKVGRWAWMRCGFDFDGEDWRDVVVKEAEAFAKQLGREVDLSFVEHSWDFLDLTEPVTTRAIADAGGPSIAGGGTVPLGMALMLGPHPGTNAWRGTLSTHAESEGRVRLEAYVSEDGNPDAAES